MNYPKQFAVGNLSDRKPRVLKRLKRWLLRNLLAKPRGQDTKGTFPASVFDTRPVQKCRSTLGTFFLPIDAIEDPAAQAILEGRLVKPEILRTAEKCIVPGTVVLEIGAGFGQLSVLFSSLVGDEGQVLAIESDEYVFDILQRNIRANRRSNIRAFLALAYDEPRAKETLTIDRLEIQAPVSFMHIHARNSEFLALRGSVETIHRFRMPIVVELEETSTLASDPTDLEAFLRSIRYRIDARIGAATVLALPEERSSLAPAPPAISHVTPVDIARPSVTINPASFQNSNCKFLKSQQEVNDCTRFLKVNGFVSHNLHCKDWDLAHLVSAIGDGNFLDMGSSDSYILMNLSLKRIRGELHGIDLQRPDVPVSGVRYSVGDLMETGLPARHFSNITCLSVLEHQIDFGRFAAEASRILVADGRLFVTFDYWEPKVQSPIKLYGLEWQPLDSETLRRFIDACAASGLHLVRDFDWTLGERVIRWGYYSPHPEVSYTFGMAVFRKS